MMPVSQAPEPPQFDEAVRMPGMRSVYEMCGLPVPANLARPAKGGKPFAQRQRRQRDANGDVVIGADGRPVEVPVGRTEDLPAEEFEPYWTTALDWLLEAYGRICAYCCFRIHPTASPSVDHMIPKSKAWDKVYEWSNYRLAALRMNARKNDLSSIIDPFDVQDGWFAIELTFGQVVPGPVAMADPALRDRVEHVITKLGLNEFAAERLRDIEAYESGDVSLKRLREESPFVAAEIARQGRLRPGDRP